MARGGTLTITAALTKADGNAAVGAETYASGFLGTNNVDYDQDPNLTSIVGFVLRDDGRGGDANAADGTYTGQITVPTGYETGAAQIYVVFQDINDVAKGTAPLTAAQTIGGLRLNAPTVDAAGDPLPSVSITVTP